MHYLDNFLVLGNSEEAVAVKLAEFKKVLATTGFFITDKSSVKAKRELVFLGKRVHFGNGTVLNTRRALEDALSRYVFMASRPSTQKVCSRLWASLSGLAGHRTGQTFFCQAPSPTYNGARSGFHMPPPTCYGLFRVRAGLRARAGALRLPPTPRQKASVHKCSLPLRVTGTTGGWGCARRQVRTTPCGCRCQKVL